VQNRRQYLRHQAFGVRILATCQEIARDAKQVDRIVAEERELASTARAATNAP
jgi:hypothetical protein